MKPIQSVLPPRAAIYIRVSTGDQADHGTSLAGQLQACIKKAEDMEAAVVSIHEDAGVSGALYHSRPGIQAALMDLETGKANCLIIANLSRYSRDSGHQSEIKKRVDAAGARLVFCDMDFADTPEGDLAFGILGKFADYERRVIRYRTMNGRRRRAEDGIQPCRNHSPFGYHVVTHKDVLNGEYPADLLGTYQVIEEQARFVKETFERVANGDSVRSVARWLTDSGVPTPRGAMTWNWGTLQRLLQHPVYKGQAVFGRFKRRHDEDRFRRGFKTGYSLVERPKEEWVSIDAPAIVDEATWDACQQRIRTNRTQLGGRPDRKYMLTGLMRCPKCKEKMRAYRKRRNPKDKTSDFYHLYECRCAKPSSSPTGKACHNKQYRGYWAEPLVMRAIEEAAKQPERMASALKGYKEAKARHELQPDIEQLQRQLAELQKQEQATAKAQVAGIMAGADTQVYETMLRDIAAKREHITIVLERAGHPIRGKATRDTDEATMIAKAINAVREVLCEPDTILTPAEKQAMLVNIIEAIYPDGKEGLRLILKPSVACNQSVAYFTIYR